jgi:hypothetical protein
MQEDDIKMHIIEMGNKDVHQIVVVWKNDHRKGFVGKVSINIRFL